MSREVTVKFGDQAATVPCSIFISITEAVREARPIFSQRGVELPEKWGWSIAGYGSGLPECEHPLFPGDSVEVFALLIPVGREEV